MAIRCEQCGREYDVTLFEFGRTVRCACGAEVDARRPHRDRPRAAGHAPGRRIPPAGEAPAAPPADVGPQNASG